MQNAYFNLHIVTITAIAIVDVVVATDINCFRIL